MPSSHSALERYRQAMGRVLETRRARRCAALGVAVLGAGPGAGLAQPPAMSPATRGARSPALVASPALPRLAPPPGVCRPVTRTAPSALGDMAGRLLWSDGVVDVLLRVDERGVRVTRAPAGDPGPAHDTTVDEDDRLLLHLPWGLDLPRGARARSGPPAEGGATVLGDSLVLTPLYTVVPGSQGALWRLGPPERLLAYLQVAEPAAFAAAAARFSEPGVLRSLPQAVAIGHLSTPAAASDDAGRWERALGSARAESLFVALGAPTRVLVGADPANAGTEGRYVRLGRLGRLTSAARDGGPTGPTPRAADSAGGSSPVPRPASPPAAPPVTGSPVTVIELHPDQMPADPDAFYRALAHELAHRLQDTTVSPVWAARLAAARDTSSRWSPPPGAYGNDGPVPDRIEQQAQEVMSAWDYLRRTATRPEDARGLLALHLLLYPGTGRMAQVLLDVLPLWQAHPLRAQGVPALDPSEAVAHLLPLPGGLPGLPSSSASRSVAPTPLRRP